jgi:hypothetical protein
MSPMSLKSSEVHGDGTLCQSIGLACKVVRIAKQTASMESDDNAGGLISQIKIHGTKPLQTIDLALPQGPKSPGAITAICGLNNTGKTRFLKDLREVLHGEWQELGPSRHDHLHAEMTSAIKPSTLFFGKAWREKTKAGILHLGSADRKLDQPRDIPDYRRTFLRFLLRQINASRPANDHIVEESWLSDAKVRRAAVASFEVELQAYLCDQEDPIVRDLQELLGANLYFRLATREPHEQVEFILIYGDGATVSFSEWSDGQQVCFYVITQLNLTRPDIVLIDEIENHLHPAYMSRVIEVLKSCARQTLIATHHPHVIFSELVDQVLYLEVLRSDRAKNPPSTHPCSKSRTYPTLKRRVVTLDDDFAKVTHAYKLFANQDAQLLRHGHRVSADADVSFYSTVLSLYSLHAAPPTQRVRPDSQTSQLAEIIREQFQHGAPLRILDIGAGIGRVAVELST